MISSDRLILIAVLISIIGTASLFLLTASSGISQVDISDVDEDHVGDKVLVKGTIYRVETYEETVIIYLKEKGCERSLEVSLNSDILDDIDRKAEIKPGAMIVVRGVVEEYEGEYTLQVENSYGLELEKKAYQSYISISSILKNPTWFEGMNVKVRGEVVTTERTNHGLKIEICPLGGGYRKLNCFIKDWDNEPNKTLVKNTPIVLKGEFKYNEYTGRWQIVSEDSPEVYRD